MEGSGFGIGYGGMWEIIFGTQERLTDPPRRSKVRPLHTEAARCSGSRAEEGRQDGGATGCLGAWDWNVAGIGVIFDGGGGAC